MADLIQRLKAYLDAPTTLPLTQAVPLGAMAGISAAVIAAVIGMPAFSSSGLGIIFGGLAVNFTSSLIDKIVHAGSERERVTVIEQGLKDGDKDVQTLVVGALTHAGPEVAAALPSTDRDELITAIEQAMRTAGGPLSVIAGRYAAALRNPSADWAALQREAHEEAATVIQEIHGVDLVEDAKQEARDIDGGVREIVSAKTVRRVSQVAIGVRGTKPTSPVSTRPCSTCGVAVPVGAAACPSCGFRLGTTAPVADPPPADPVALTITLTPTTTGATMMWEGAMIGTRTSTFISPFRGPDLDLILKVLDVLQYPSTGFTAAEADRFTAIGIPYHNGILTHEAALVIGQILFRALTADGEAAIALASLRDRATIAGLPFQIGMHFPREAVALAALPWELLWDPTDPNPLLLSRGPTGSLTRHLNIAQPTPPPRHDGAPLRILAIAPQANLPADMHATERAARMAAWQPLIARGAVEVLPDVSPATRVAVSDALRHNAPIDVLHFIGHGRFDAGKGYLGLDKTNGQIDPTPIDELAGAFASARVQLAVLTACQGAMVGATPTAAGLLSGVAPTLIHAGVPLVVAMQFTVRQAAANRATGVIYERLAAGDSLQAAVAAARLDLRTTERGTDYAAWYVPTLFMRWAGEVPARLR